MTEPAVQSDFFRASPLTQSELAAQTILAMTFDAFEASSVEGVEVRVPWWPTQLFWFVPRTIQAEALVRQGIPRGRIFTTAELRRILAQAPTRAALELFVRGKVFMDGEVEGGP